MGLICLPVTNIERLDSAERVILIQMFQDGRFLAKLRQVRRVQQGSLLDAATAWMKSGRHD